MIFTLSIHPSRAKLVGVRGGFGQKERGPTDEFLNSRASRVGVLEWQFAARRFLLFFLIHRLFSPWSAVLLRGLWLMYSSMHFSLEGLKARPCDSPANTFHVKFFFQPCFR